MVTLKININNYGDGSILLFTYIYSLMFKIKMEDLYEDDLIKDKSNVLHYLTKSKYYNDSDKLAIDIMKNKTCGFVI